MHEKPAAAVAEMYTEAGESTSSSPHAAPLPTPKQVFVGRQPIYTRELEVFAYDVLFPGGEKEPDPTAKRYQAMSQLIVNALLDIGLDKIVGSKRALISLNGGPLLLDYALTLPADRVIIGVTDNALFDSILLDRVLDLSAHGYLIAVESLIAQDFLEALEKIASLISIDIAALEPDRLTRQVKALRRADVALLATNVRTPDDFAFCKTLGFTYFQGAFLCRPDVLKGRRSATNRLPLLQLLARLQDPRVEIREVEALISRDVSLSYKVLQVINSAFFGLPIKIDSIRRAVLLLGLKTIMTWVSLIMLTGIDDKPHELLTTAMVRARMCELLARAMQQDRQETFFLVGLFSVLDALTDTPMPEVLAALPLADEVNQALLSQEGLLGTTLRCVLAYEQGRWDEVACPGLDSDTILSAYLDATTWATEVRHTLCRS